MLTKPFVSCYIVTEQIPSFDLRAQQQDPKRQLRAVARQQLWVLRGASARR